MFEKAKSISPAQSARFSGESVADAELLIGSTESVRSQPGRGGTALRMIEWGELKARLNAARDLRLILRHDVRGNIEANGSSFADAAANYFRTRDNPAETEPKQYEPDVNPIALGGSKASPDRPSGLDEFRDERTSNRGQAATGDARED